MGNFEDYGKHCLVLFLGTCLMLIGVFVIDIKHDREMKAIWDKYYLDMRKLHESDFINCAKYQQRVDQDKILKEFQEQALPGYN